MFKLQSGKKFLATPRKTPKFYVDRLVPASGITLIFGPPSCGKSTLLWTMANNMWRKEKFLDTYQTTKARTMLLNLDMPGDRVWHRMKDANFDAKFWICDFPNHINITTLHTIDPPTYTLLQEAAHRFQVIMIDSLSAITTGLSLKDDWVPGVTVSALRALFPTQAIVLLHHSRKQTMGQFGPIPPHREDALGSQFWMAMVQSELQMYLKGDHLAHLRIAKSQVAPMEDGVDLNVDDGGCMVELFDDNANTTWLKKLNAAEITAINTDPKYKGKTLVDKCDVLGKILTPPISGRSVRRWMKRVNYNPIP